MILRYGKPVCMYNNLRCEKFFMCKIVIIFLFIGLNICFGCLKEQSH